ncbi:hypothetical protein BAQ46_22955 [Bacillus paranthracis]|nr:hypothetical protein BAQ46_22955 [Bacillus paranthracis]
MLLFPEDKPKPKKKSVNRIDYIPDYVLEQLFNHINDLHKEVIPVVWIAFKTGHRISDVLGVTSDCLVKLSGQYSIETDIAKTYVQGHRIPIDDELADILTIQELLAHTSPETTLRYAKLLDETKRKAFESIINQGVFSFNLNGEVQEIKAGEDIPEDILGALWQS